MNMQTLAMAFMAAMAVGGIAWVFLYPYLFGEAKAEKRRASFAQTAPAARQIDK
ncbi:MAG TPA: pilus assembly protein, partial [Bradyrhizobium sp.]|nr:pilus assembly protein [Bradyrhizobium sp.]